MIVYCKYCKAECGFSGEQRERNCKGYIPMTNADRIRAMSDEEIAQWLCLHYGCTKCLGQELCTINDGKHNGLTKWLKQPAEKG